MVRRSPVHMCDGARGYDLRPVRDRLAPADGGTWVLLEVIDAVDFNSSYEE